MLRKQGRKTLQDAQHGLRFLSFSGPQVVLYRFITSGTVDYQSASRVSRTRRPLLFHRPLPDSKHNDVYRRSSKPVPRRPPTHFSKHPSYPVQPSSLSSICIDPANFAPISPPVNVRRQDVENSNKPPLRADVIPSVEADTLLQSSVIAEYSSPDELHTETFTKPEDPVSSDAKESADHDTGESFRGSTSKSTRKASSKDNRSPSAKLLKPYDLAQEVQEMCSRGDIDGAIRRLKSTPRDAQNTAVWNTMISHCEQAGKHNCSYDVFNEMKRRGFSPSVATYTTMFKGLSRVADWSKRSKQLARVHTLYEYYMKHIESVKYYEPENTGELSTAPLVFYITILGEVGDRQKTFDVFFALDSEGSFVPDKYLFCAMFDAIARCQEKAPTSSDVPSTNTSKSDAKYVWLQVEKMAQRLPDFEVDSGVIAAAVRALTRGRSSDQALALDISTKYLGLAMLGERKTFRLSRFLTPRTLDASLTLCNAIQQYRLCVYFMHQVIGGLDFDKPYMRQIIDRNHVQKLLRAHSALARRGSRNESLPALEAVELCLANDAIYKLPKLRPNHQTYHLLFMTCWRNADWARAMRAFELMTGIQPTSFPNSNEGKLPPITLTRPAKENLSPDLETMSFIMRTALVTKDVVHYRQAMWLADYVNLSAMFSDAKADIFYRTRVAQPLLPIIARLEGEVPAETFRKWNHLRLQAEEVLRDSGETSERVRRSLGSSWSFEDVDDTGMAIRYNNSGQDT
ncbi:hypothetical protein J3A83DRAFT_4157211 [Scleroderma citrinum]